MPCVKPARGTRNGGADSHPPFSDAINNNPCGRKIVLTVNGVSVSAENLCSGHWIEAHGYRDYVLPVTTEP